MNSHTSTLGDMIHSVTYTFSRNLSNYVQHQFSQVGDFAMSILQYTSTACEWTCALQISRPREGVCMTITPCDPSLGSVACAFHKLFRFGGQQENQYDSTGHQQVAELFPPKLDVMMDGCQRQGTTQTWAVSKTKLVRNCDYQM